jgi:two-component system, OmpR family, sensor histidine kinase KdpD
MAAASFGVVLVYRRILHVNQTTVALTFLVMVQLAAFRWGLVYSVCLSFLCTLLYNYYFLPPIGSFTIADPQNWIALVAFLASAIFISRISESERRQRSTSESRRSEMERLYEFSNQLLMEENLQDVASHAAHSVAAIFAFNAVVVYLTETDSAYSSDPRRALVSMDELRAAARQPEGQRPDRNGLHIVPILVGMRSSGAIAMTGPRAVYSDGLYEAVGGLLGIALERAAALDRTSRMEATRESERLRTALLDSVTHELRTPLTAIRAASSLLSQSSLGESERHEMYAVIDEESARLDRLIGQTVEMAQLDTAGIVVRLKPQRLQEVIETALEDCRGLLRGRPISVDLPELPLIPLDRELIRRVLRHLLENAARYSPAGSPVRIAAVMERDRLRVSITDSGQGIDEAEQAYIFDKFYRGSRQRVLHGTGMGLAIAKAILRALGGGIEVASQPDQGATFTFWVPVLPPAPT